jgi:hypothetical protein
MDFLLLEMGSSIRSKRNGFPPRAGIQGNSRGSGGRGVSSPPRPSSPGRRLAVTAKLASSAFSGFAAELIATTPTPNSSSNPGVKGGNQVQRTPSGPKAART